MMSPRKRRRGDANLSADELVSALDSAINDHGSADLAVLHLLSRYQFDIDDLHRILREKSLKVTFFKVKYRDIAPRVDLDPTLAGNDMQQFFIHRARIPTRLFRDIVSDLEVIMNQYGEPVNHKNVEARSRFLAPLFNRTVALFKLAITNAPESMIHGRLTTKERIEYHFLVFGGISVLVIEVRYVLGVAQERLDAIAQVIAECDACDYSNELLGFSFPIYGILCDGESFEFFAFDGSTDPPTVSRGVFKGNDSKPYETLIIANFQGSSEKDFIFSLRPICESLFYLLLLAYKTGIAAYQLWSATRAMHAERPRASTPSWDEAAKLAGQALELAVDAATKAAARDDVADEIMERALEKLNQSVAAIPASHRRSIDLMNNWDEEGAKFC